MSEVDELKTQLANLKKIRATGLRSVSHGDTRNDFGDIQAAINEIEAELARLEGRRRLRYAYQSGKGL